MENKTAVVILNYFGFSDTLKCIQSVFSTLDSYVFLVDNSANNVEKGLLEKQYQNNANISLYFPNENLGFAAGVNLGIKAAVEEGYLYFLILNNDAVLLEGSGAKIQDVLKKHPTSLITPSIKWAGSTVKDNYYHKYLGLLSHQAQNQKRGWLHYLSGCALAFDRGFIDSVGFFDESFFMYGEDAEYCYRAASKCIPLISLKEELVIHEGSKSSKRASLFYEYHVTRSHFLLVTRTINNRFYQLVTFMGKSTVLSLRATWRSLKYQSIAPLAALFLAPFPLHIRPKQR